MRAAIASRSPEASSAFEVMKRTSHFQCQRPSRGLAQDPPQAVGAGRPSAVGVVGGDGVGRVVERGEALGVGHHEPGDAQHALGLHRGVTSTSTSGREQLAVAAALGHQRRHPAHRGADHRRGPVERGEHGLEVRRRGPPSRSGAPRATRCRRGRGRRGRAPGSRERRGPRPCPSRRGGSGRRRAAAGPAARWPVRPRRRPAARRAHRRG